MTKHTMGIDRTGHVQESVAAPNGKAPSASPDDHSHYPALPDLTRLRALSQERPSRKMALIRRSWPDILAALKAGHSLIEGIPEWTPKERSAFEVVEASEQILKKIGRAHV